MSFILEFRRLFKVSVRENGAGPPLPGFSFEPTPATQVGLADHQLLFRARDAGFEVFYRSNPLVTPALLGAISGPVRFSFAMRQSDPDFLKRYEPDLTPATGPQFYLDNLTAAGVIQPNTTDTLAAGAVVQAEDATRVYPPVFQVAADTSGPQAPTKFVVREKFNPGPSPVAEALIGVADGAAQGLAKIDLSKQATGAYTLKTDAPGAVAHTIYVDEELAEAGVFGVVNIHWQSAQDTAPAGGVPYVIRFRKR